MYLKNFGFTEKPFHITPNARFIFLSKNHREAFAHLLYGIQQRLGFLCLTGEVGTGKTTVLRTLLGQLAENEYQVALIFNPCLSALELLQVIHKEFGLSYVADTATLVQLHDSLNRFLLQQRNAGKTVVLVIDEAQNLDIEILEQLRLLSNLETETEKLIQMILVGQPELDQMLQRNNLRQLRQRLAVRYQLNAMNAVDTTNYIIHRLKVAGGQGEEIFSSRALKLLNRFSGGTPRLINILCDRALLVAYGRNSRRVTHQDVRMAQGELNFPAPRSYGRRATILVALLLILMIGYLGSDRLFLTLADAVRTIKDNKPQLMTVSGNVLDSPTLEINTTSLSRVISAFTSESSFQGAYVALSGLWQRKPTSPLPKVKSNADLYSAMNAAGFKTIEMQTQFSELVKLDSPAILRIVLPGVSGSRFFALTEVDGTRAKIEPALTESGWLEKERLEQVWFGKAFLPYLNVYGLGVVSRPGIEGKQIHVLQRLLTQVGLIDSPTSGIYDQQTIDAVMRFQAEHRLTPDGMVGTQTLYWLYKEADLKMPRLSKGAKS